MATIFDYTILTNLTLIAIVTAVYVFFAAIKGSSVKRSEECLIEVIRKRNTKINETLKKSKGDDQIIHKLHAEEEGFNKQISKVTCPQ